MKTKIHRNCPLHGWHVVIDGDEQRLYRDGDDEHRVTIDGSNDHDVVVTFARGDHSAERALVALLTGSMAPNQPNPQSRDR